MAYQVSPATTKHFIDLLLSSPAPVLRSAPTNTTPAPASSSMGGMVAPLIGAVALGAVGYLVGGKHAIAAAGAGALLGAGVAYVAFPATPPAKAA